MQVLADHVGGRLRATIAVVATRSVVFDGSDPARNDGHPGSFPEIVEQCSRDAQRTDRIDLVLLEHLTVVDATQGILFEDARIVDQDVDGFPVESVCQSLACGIVSDLDALDDSHVGLSQFGARLPTNRNDVIPSRGHLPCHFESDAAIRPRNDYNSHIIEYPR